MLCSLLLLCIVHRVTAQVGGGGGLAGAGGVAGGGGTAGAGGGGAAGGGGGSAGAGGGGGQGGGGFGPNGPFGGFRRMLSRFAADPGTSKKFFSDASQGSTTMDGGRAQPLPTYFTPFSFHIDGDGRRRKENRRGNQNVDTEKQNQDLQFGGFPLTFSNPRPGGSFGFHLPVPSMTSTTLGTQPAAAGRSFQGGNYGLPMIYSDEKKKSRKLAAENMKQEAVKNSGSKGNSIGPGFISGTSDTVGFEPFSFQFGPDLDQQHFGIQPGFRGLGNQGGSFGNFGGQPGSLGGQLGGFGGQSGGFGGQSGGLGNILGGLGLGNRQGGFGGLGRQQGGFGGLGGQQGGFGGFGNQVGSLGGFGGPAGGFGGPAGGFGGPAGGFGGPAGGFGGPAGGFGSFVKQPGGIGGMNGQTGGKSGVHIVERPKSAAGRAGTSDQEYLVGPFAPPYKADRKMPALIFFGK